MDRFLRALPYEAKKLACQSNLQSAEQLVALVEGHQVAQAVLQTSRPGKTKTPGRPRNPTPTPEPVRPPRQVLVERQVLLAEVRRCYTYGDIGQLSWECPHRQDVSMPSASSDLNPRKPCGLLTVCWVHPIDPGQVTRMRPHS